MTCTWPFYQTVTVELYEGLVQNFLHNSYHTFFCVLVYRVHSLAHLSESSDVYSFGVFLLELITGREAAGLIPPESKEPLAHWVKSRSSTSSKETYLPF